MICYAFTTSVANIFVNQPTGKTNHLNWHQKPTIDVIFVMIHLFLSNKRPNRLFRAKNISKHISIQTEQYTRHQIIILFKPFDHSDDAPIFSNWIYNTAQRLSNSRITQQSKFIHPTSTNCLKVLKKKIHLLRHTHYSGLIMHTYTYQRLLHIACTFTHYTYR